MLEKFRFPKPDRNKTVMIKLNEVQLWNFALDQRTNRKRNIILFCIILLIILPLTILSPYFLLLGILACLILFAKTLQETKREYYKLLNTYDKEK